MCLVFVRVVRVSLSGSDRGAAGLCKIFGFAS